MNVKKYFLIQQGFKTRLNEVKPWRALQFFTVFDRVSSIKIRAQIRRGEFD